MPLHGKNALECVTGDKEFWEDLPYFPCLNPAECLSLLVFCGNKSICTCGNGGLFSQAAVSKARYRKDIIGNNLKKNRKYEIFHTEKEHSMVMDGI